MGNKTKESKSERITRETLLDLIAESTIVKSEEEREYLFKRKILTFFLSKEMSVDTESDLLQMVEQNELLSCFAFFLSVNPKSRYNWSYFRHKEAEFVKSLYNVANFIKGMLDDVNLLIEKYPKHTDYQFVFNDLFSFGIKEESPFTEVAIDWSNFRKFGCLKKEGYFITLKIENATVLGSFRKYGDSICKFTEMIDGLNK